MIRQPLTVACLLALAACASNEAGTQETTAAADDACNPSAEVIFPIPENPLVVLDAMGPLSDVSCNWQHYQPAEAFCVQLSAPEYTPGGSGPLTDGRDAACAASGYKPQDTGLYKVTIQTPPLCPGCRRFFIDLSQVPAGQSVGHVFYVLASFNPTYTIDPLAHSPNTKNFTNDWLLSPPDTFISTVVRAQDLYAKDYVTHAGGFAHTAIQGPYYVGPWYLNREGQRITGVYVDIDAAGAIDMGNPNLNAIRYIAGYNDGFCPDALLGLAGLDVLYAGCADHPGTSRIALDPLS